MLCWCHNAWTGCSVHIRHRQYTSDTSLLSSNACMIKSWEKVMGKHQNVPSIMDSTFWCLPITLFLSSLSYMHLTTISWCHWCTVWYVHCSLPEGRGSFTATESLHSAERVWEWSPKCHHRHHSECATQTLSLSLLSGYSVVRWRHLVCVVITTVSEMCICKSDNWWHWHSFQFRAYFNFLTTFLGLILSLSVSSDTSRLHFNSVQMWLIVGCLYNTYNKFIAV